MKLLKIKGVVPSKAGDNTNTPGRRFMQVTIAPVTEAGVLNSEREHTKNVWEGYVGVGKISGAQLNIQADPLFNSILEQLSLPEGFQWGDGKPINKLTPTPAAFRNIIGLKVEGDIYQEYVEPYEVPNSQSQNPTRVKYTAVVLKGENKAAIFAAQGHPIVAGERLEAVIAMEAEITAENSAARLERKSVASTGAHTAV